MQYEDVRRELLRQWTYTGGPNEDKASELYHDDAVLEFPQSGERFAGKANIQGWCQRYPARLDFEPRELRGSGDIWVAETGLRYDGGEPVHVVKILQFPGGQGGARDPLLRRGVPGPRVAPAVRRRRHPRAPRRPPGHDPRRKLNPGRFAPLDLGIVGTWPTRTCSPWSSPAARGSGCRR